MRLKKLRFFRYIVQIALLVLYPGMFAMVFGELKLIYTSVINGSFDISKVFPSIIEIIVVMFLTALIGRFFCGWICAFGTVADLAYAIFGKLFTAVFRSRIQFRIKSLLKAGHKPDSILKYLKYGILAFIIIAIWTANVTFFKSASPWDAFAQLGQFQRIFTMLLPGFILLLAIIAISAFVERAFCRYLCPLGAIFSLISGARTVNVRKPRENCGKCALCTARCSMNLGLGKKDYIENIDCINCFECVSVCPRKNAHANFLEKDLDPALAGALAIAAFAGLYSFSGAVGNSISLSSGTGAPAGTIASSDIAAGAADSAEAATEVPTEANPSVSSKSTAKTGTKPAAAATSPSSASKYKDGTYTGIGNGFRPNLTVQVVVRNGKIASIEIVSSNDTPLYLNAVASRITGEIISSQSTQVAAVSGATYSSIGIMDAVADALGNALQ